MNHQRAGVIGWKPGQGSAVKVRPGAISEYQVTNKSGTASFLPASCVY